MHIAFIGLKDVSEEGGTYEQAATELATHLVREGMALTVFVRGWFRRRMRVFNGIVCKTVPTLPIRGIGAVWQAFLSSVITVTTRRFDVIHYHGAVSALFAWLPRLLRPQTIVIVSLYQNPQQHTRHGSLMRFLLFIAEKTAIRYAHQVIVANRPLANDLLLRYGVRAAYIPMGVPVVRLATNSALLRVHGLQVGEYALCVSDGHDVDVLLEAWGQVPHPSGMKLVIVSADEAAQQRLAPYARKATGDPHVQYAGIQVRETRKALYQGALFIVDPSSSADQARRLLTAMSYGKAVVAADVLNRKEVMAEYGIPFLTGSAEDLAQKMQQFTMDPLHAASVGHTARVYVEEVFHAPSLAQEITNIYNKHIALREGVLAIH